ncbi:MAG: hypothetical protein ACRDQ4_08905 [Pseudonocardiaceae bacterium]
MVGNTWREVVPAWVVPSVGEVAEYGGMAFRLAEITECVQARGQCAALCWLIGRDPAPITRSEGLVTPGGAVWESWLALCLAAGRPVVVEEERARLGIPQRRTGGQVPWWAHGVWRTLGWLVGERSDPPIQLPVRAVDGSIVPGTEVFTVRRNPESALWRAAEEGRERRELAEAVEQWRKVRPGPVPTGV